MFYVLLMELLIVHKLAGTAHTGDIVLHFLLLGGVEPQKEGKES